MLPLCQALNVELGQYSGLIMKVSCTSTNSFDSLFRFYFVSLSFPTLVCYLLGTVPHLKSPMMRKLVKGQTIKTGKQEILPLERVLAPADISCSSQLPLALCALWRPE